MTPTPAAGSVPAGVRVVHGVRPGVTSLVVQLHQPIRRHINLHTHRALATGSPPGPKVRCCRGVEGPCLSGRLALMLGPGAADDGGVATGTGHC